MSRNKKNIKMQLHEILNGMMRFGEKKEKEQPGGAHYNPNRAPGIHSYRTADTYRDVIDSFGEYCKQAGVKKVGQIYKATVAGYMDSRRQESSWTASKDLAAINKVLGTHYTPKEFGFSRRTQDKVVHNRGVLTDNSTRASPLNADALHFARATGCRRQSILLATPAQAIRSEDGTVIGFHLREKGGRVRDALVLPSERGWLTSFVNDREAERGVYGKLIDHCDSHCNPHFDRGVYAQTLYREMMDARETGTDVYAGHRETFINQDALDKALRTSPYRYEYAHGFNVAVCAEISQQMGHNRVDVVIRSYLNK